jgi:hypothetical protein
VEDRPVLGEEDDGEDPEEEEDPDAREQVDADAYRCNKTCKL